MYIDVNSVSIIDFVDLAKLEVGGGSFLFLSSFCLHFWCSLNTLCILWCATCLVLLIYFFSRKKYD